MGEQELRACEKRLRAPALPGTWHLVWVGLGRFEEFGCAGEALEAVGGFV